MDSRLNLYVQPQKATLRHKSLGGLPMQIVLKLRRPHVHMLLLTNCYFLACLVDNVLHQKLVQCTKWLPQRQPLPKPTVVEEREHVAGHQLLTSHWAGSGKLFQSLHTLATCRFPLAYHPVVNRHLGCWSCGRTPRGSCCRGATCLSHTEEP